MTPAHPLVASSLVARELIGMHTSSTTSSIASIAETGIVQKPKRGALVQTEVKAIDGAARWVVKGFSRLEDKEGWWKMQLFPSGGGRNDGASAEGHISLYLFATRSPTKAKYSFRLLNARPKQTPANALPGPEGLLSASGMMGVVVPADSTAADDEWDDAKVTSHYQCNGSAKSFGTPSEGWGFLKFCRRKSILDGPWAQRDEICLEAQVSVVTGIYHMADAYRPGGDNLCSMNQMQRHLQEMFESGILSDISFHVTSGSAGSGRATVFKAHRFILMTRSSFFRVMLAHDMVESKSGVVSIPYCRPAIFCALLRFLYTGACEVGSIDAGSSPSKDEKTSLISALDDDGEVNGEGEKVIDIASSLDHALSGHLHVSSSSSSSVSDHALPEEGEPAAAQSDESKSDSVPPLLSAESLRTRQLRSARLREFSGRRRQQLATQGGGEVRSDVVLELLCCAHRFDAADLCSLCEYMLMDTLSIENCVHRCHMADSLGGLPLLRAVCMKYVTLLSPTMRNTPVFTSQLKLISRDLLIELMTAQPPLGPIVSPAPDLAPTSSSASPRRPSATSTTRVPALQYPMLSSASATASSTVAMPPVVPLALAIPPATPITSVGRKRPRATPEQTLPSGNMGGGGGGGGGGDGDGGATVLLDDDEEASESDDGIPTKRLRSSDLASMKNAELQRRLGALGLRKSGNKAELIARLSRALSPLPSVPVSGSPPLPVPLAMTLSASSSSSSSQSQPLPLLSSPAAPLASLVP